MKKIMTITALIVLVVSMGIYVYLLSFGSDWIERQNGFDGYIIGVLNTCLMAGAAACCAIFFPRRRVTEDGNEVN